MRFLLIILEALYYINCPLIIKFILLSTRKILGFVLLVYKICSSKPFSQFIVTTVFFPLNFILTICCLLSQTLNTRICVEWRKSWINVYCWHEHCRVKTSRASESWKWQTFLLVPAQILTTCTEIIKYSFLLVDIYSLRLLTLYRDQY